MIVLAGVDAATARSMTMVDVVNQRLGDELIGPPLHRTAAVPNGGLRYSVLVSNDLSGFVTPGGEGTYVPYSAAANQPPPDSPEFPPGGVGDLLAMVRTARFSVSRRGYDPDEVSGFLDQLQEYFSHGELSPSERYNLAALVRGTKFHLERRGYDASEVDEFCDTLVQRLSEQADPLRYARGN